MNETIIDRKLHELYLSLINAKSTIQPIPSKMRMRKRCGVAQWRDNNISQKERNIKVEAAYIVALAKIKKLFVYCKHPVFERNYRRDNRESALMMHAYLNNSFYFLLECDFHFNYQLEFAFYNCPFEKEIRALFSQFPIGIQAKEAKFNSDFNTLYLGTLKVQDKQYITY